MVGKTTTYGGMLGWVMGFKGFWVVGSWGYGLWVFGSLWMAIGVGVSTKGSSCCVWRSGLVFRVWFKAKSEDLENPTVLDE
jgi:hypothetical protein